MRILLLGKSGLLGSAIFSVFRNEHELVTPPHELCDVAHREELERVLDTAKPELVINATGYTAVDMAEQKRNEVFRLNVEAVRNLAQLLAVRKIPLVHFSTDYVFDGSKSGGYAEDDSPNPINTYGASKAAGEAEIAKSGIPHYLIRTSWLFGEGGRNFVDKIVEQARGNKPIRVVSDQIGCPTYNRDLAQALLHLLKQQPYGMYHIVNSGSCSWFEFAEEIFRQLGWPQKITRISSDALGAAAKRPKCSILLNSKLPPLRHWKEALSDVLKEKVLTLSPK